MISVANITAHRQTVHVSAKIILKSGAYQFLSIINIFGSYEAYDCVDKKRIVMTSKAIAPTLHNKLVCAVMRIR